jgi:hypothetical protein
MTDLFSYNPSAKQLADEGMRQAADHADAEEPRWTDRAYEALENFARTHREFMTEDARTWAHQNGLPMPPDKRAWGAVTKRAQRANIVVIERYQSTRIPPAHASPRPVWGSRIYGGIDL